jgi:serine protease Do
MSVLQMLRGRAACWLLALALCTAAVRTGAQSNSTKFATPPVPTPVPVSIEDLPAAFNKPAPTSLSDLREIQDRVAALVTQVSPAVVAVELGHSSGSGVVISADGLVLTAGHVGGWVGHPATFTFPNGKIAKGKTIGVDEDSDTGLMQITDPGPWPHVGVGELKHAHLGDWALALGNPGGYDAKRSLVVRLGRIIRLMPGVVQTDCMIFPGDSGGPLFDMYGRVIGVHTAIAISADENFHVPITEFFETWSDLVGPPSPPAPTPSPARPMAYCGLSVIDDAEGCCLSKIEKNSPAAKANLRAGDHVLKVDGRRIEVSASFLEWIAESEPGETLRLDIKRGNKSFPVQIKLQAQPRLTK